MIFIVGGRRQQTSNVLIEIIVNSNLRKEENYIFIQKESIYDNVLWVVGLFMKFYFLLKTRAFVRYEKSTSFDPFAVTFENGRDGQKAGRLFISGCIDRDGG